MLLFSCYPHNLPSIYGSSHEQLLVNTTWRFSRTNLKRYKLSRGAWAFKVYHTKPPRKQFHKIKTFEWHSTPPTALGSSCTNCHFVSTTPLFVLFINRSPESTWSIPILENQRYDDADALVSYETTGAPKHSLLAWVLTRIKPSGIEWSHAANSARKGRRGA
jgi:hypothetical protein